MARYIDADRFKSNLEKAMGKMHVIGGVKAVGMEAVIEALNRQPTADVVPKSEVAREILSDIKKQVQNKMVHAVSKDEYSYINIKVFDAILQNYLNNLK